jgi:serine/threonine-protein kinase
MIAFACPHCGRGLEAPEVQAGRDVPCPGCGRPAPVAAPVLPTLPGYEILQELGRGGNAVVYKARQLHPRRLVAVKMILAGAHAGADAVARFRREAEALARLSHPNIVPIHQVGEHAGRPFLILEYVEGGNLARHLKGRQLSFTDAATLVGRLARAVHHAHQRGILHRDLKPGNILLDAQGTPHVTDFGLAKLLDPAMAVADSGRTQSGAVVGTPGYMAPEQAGGKGKKVGPATDVWALGAILYECLAGRPPFQATTVIETLLQVANEEPVAPSKLRPDSPRELQAVCLKCLEKDPRRRYGSAQELGEDLDRYLAGKPLQAQGRRPLRGLIRLVRRHREVSFLVAGAAVALAIVAVILLLPPRQLQPESPPPPPAPPRPAVAEDDLPQESQMLRGMQDSMRRVRRRGQMTQLAVALRQMHKAKGSFPPAALADIRTGRPLLSWRVAVLPHLEEEALYREFKLDEPWDSPHNRPLLKRMPAVFAPQGTAPSEGRTDLQVLVGPGAAFEPGPGGVGRSLREFTDGTGATILFVEGAEPVEWTKPADLVYDPKGPPPRLGKSTQDAFAYALADGSVVEMQRDTPEAVLRALITRNGGEPQSRRGLPFPYMPVTGRLTVRGVPCPGGRVRFHAEGDPTEVVQMGRAEADGTYHVYGLLQGRYRVSVHGPAGAKESVPSRYADPATSGLQAEVHGGQQTFDVEIDDKNDKDAPGKRQ